MNKNFRLIVAATMGLVMCSAASAMKIGDMASDFARTDLAGEQVKLSQYRGKWVLLNFWASWCAPCREEMPEFSRWQRDYRAKGLQIIGVSLDDDVASVKQFLAEYPVSYPIVMADVKLVESVGGVLGVPLTYLIDPQGRIIARYQGEADLPEMETKVRQLLSVDRN